MLHNHNINSCLALVLYLNRLKYSPRLIENNYILVTKGKKIVCIAFFLPSLPLVIVVSCYHLKFSKECIPLSTCYIISLFYRAFEIMKR